MSYINWEVEDFCVQAYHNGDFCSVKKKDLLGHWSILFFYPADFTFVCPTELSDLQDYYEEFKAAGCEIYSVSCDTHFVLMADTTSSCSVRLLIISSALPRISFNSALASSSIFSS